MEVKRRVSQWINGIFRSHSILSAIWHLESHLELLLEVNMQTSVQLRESYVADKLQPNQALGLMLFILEQKLALSLIL